MNASQPVTPEPSKFESHADYLGDSVYVERTQDNMIRLFTFNGFFADDEIFLEPEAAEALLRWIKRWCPHIKDSNSALRAGITEVLQSGLSHTDQRKLIAELMGEA